MMRTAVFSTALIFGGLRRFGAVLFGIGAIREEAQLEACFGPTVGSGAAARFHSQTPIALADLVICPFPHTMRQTEPDEFQALATRKPAACNCFSRPSACSSHASKVFGSLSGSLNTNNKAE